MIVRFLQRIGLIHKHEWVVQWNDDDACKCGTRKAFPSGMLFTP